jgi:hypothetical protein
MPNRDLLEDQVPKVGRGVRHAPSGARRTHAAVFAGEGDEQLLAAGGTADPGEAVAKRPPWILDPLAELLPAETTLCLPAARQG